MKKLYILSLLFLSSVAAMAQTIYSENFGTPPSGNPTATAYTGYNNGTGTGITYTGMATLRNSNASSGYTGVSGNGNVFFSANSTQDFTISGLNTAAYSSADLVLTFGLRQDASNTTQPAPATSLVVEKSTNGTDWEALTYTRTSASSNAWELITINGGVIPASATLSLRFRQNGAAASRLDDVKVAVVSASCTFALGAGVTSTCNTTTLSDDMVLITVPYTGGGNATYIVTATTAAGPVQVSGNPSATAAGDLTMTVAESTAVTLTVTGGTCNTTLDIVAAACKPINTLPYAENFAYVVGASLPAQQKWTVANSGDNVLISAGNLSYPGITSLGQSATFSGTGAEAWSPFTPTTTGTIYASFLMNVTDMSNVTTDGTETVFFALTGNDAANYRARIFIKKAGEQYLLGLANGSTTTNYTTSAYNVGDVVMVVIKGDFATNTISAWINPALATFDPATTPATLSETLAAALPGMGGVILRQDDAAKTPTIVVDELRVSTDFATLSTERNNEIAGLRIYPNPVTGNVLHITTANSGEKAVAIYDVLGKQVVNTVTTDAVNVAGLNSGVYIVKITEAGATATKKLVIK